VQQIYEPVGPAVLPSPAASQAPSCKLDRNSGALERDEYGKFVQFFRHATPYIEGHRSRTFVIVIPGEQKAVGLQQQLQGSTQDQFVARCT
jgi:hypothetical protein